MDGITKLHEVGASVRVPLRDLADDLADYIAMRPESARVIDGLASYLAGLHPATGPPRPAAAPGLLPGEADDIAANADPERWIMVYQHLVDAAEMTGVAVEHQVHLVSRLAYWHSRQVDRELAGRTQEATLRIMRQA